MDLAALREEFPALRRFTWLNTGVAAPGARPVLAALRRVQDEWESGEFSWQGWEREAYDTRAQFAGLIGADEESVALVSSVAEAAATVAASLPPGRVVVGSREFASNYFPWLVLRDRGFEVVAVPATDGVVSTDALAEHTTEGTVLLAVSEVQSSNGYRVNLPRLARKAREVGARLFVNLTQALGALQFDVADTEPDYVVAHGYKWLLGPRGCAWLYVRPGLLEETMPLAASWKTREDPYADYYVDSLELPKTAQRLDTPFSWFPWAGARAALELLGALDLAAVERRSLELADAFARGAADRGFRLSPREEPSQLLGLVVPDPDRVRHRLRERRVVAAVRGGFLRVGFHAFNNESDLQTALEALEEA